MPDHIHILLSIKPDIALSNLVRDIKANSSKWLKEQHAKYSDFSWQEGFGAFSYSKSQIDNVVNYILHQEEHHKNKTFKEEYVEFLRAFEIEFDNKYLFEFY